ncbi:MAG: hypothetical protein ACD_71C00114G0004 [uncultured bacterium (gcode 4)]|uniref:Uncharacterized protein n=1 Tax=uncultured bacterium (gcode 4) TaxID=1234023 RepID=K1Z5H0_9BACT|nr:MAG: hypothetical protein ACD_71C00114G0004 [uncultured bacterium (gcode 4)]
MAGEVPSDIDIQTAPRQEISDEITTGDIDAIAWKFLLADASDTKTRAEALYGRQNQERNNTEVRYQNACSDVRDITCVRLWKTPETLESPSEKITRAKHELYKALGIKEWVDNLDNFWRFQLWLADGLVWDNLQIAEELLKIGMDKVAEILIQMLWSIDKVKDFILSAWERVFEDIKNLLSLQPYDTGKAIWWLGLGVIWSIGKSLWKATVKEVAYTVQKEAVEKGVMDVLEWKGRYMIPLTTHPNIMTLKIREFSENIDVKYLVDNPERIDAMNDIVEHFSKYIVQNEASIHRLKPQELQSLKSDFMWLWGNYSKLLGNPSFTPSKMRTMKDIKKEDMTNAYYSLNPESRPKPE